MKPGDILLSGEHALPQGRGEERSGVRRRARQARRHLGQRRLLRRAPRARLDRRPRPQAAGLCRPHHAGRARGAGEGAGGAEEARSIAIVGGAKVSTKLDLLENLIAKVDALVIGGAMANTFLHAPGHQGRQIAGREGPGRHRAPHPGQGRGRQLRRSSCRSTPSSRMHFEANAPSHASGVDAISARRHDARRRPRSRSSAIKGAIDDAATLVWNGPFGAFEMHPFDKARSRSPDMRRPRDQGRQARFGRRRRRHRRGAERGGRGGHFTYVSTAGGAFLEWMEGKALPGVEVLRQK